MVGALGACFGRVVTLDSPRARPPGTFNWAATLWHELAHVVTLQLSNQRVPRWLTEGASVFEERRADASWGREGEIDFLRAYGAGKAIPLAVAQRRLHRRPHHRPRVPPVVAARRAPRRAVRRRRAAEAAGRLRPRPGAGRGAPGRVRRRPRQSADVVRRVPRRPLQGPEGGAGAHRRRAAGDRQRRPEGDRRRWSASPTRTPASTTCSSPSAARLIARGAKDQARKVLERAVPLVPQTMGDESALALLAGLSQERGDVDAALGAARRAWSRNRTPRSSRRAS